MITLPPAVYKQFDEIYKQIKSGELRTLIPLLSLLRINGRPFTLERHFMFAPMFNTRQTPQMIFMIARQLGKSYSLCASSILRSMVIPGYHQLLLQPQADQIQRLNASVYQPLLKGMPLIRYFMPSVEANKLALKTYNNGSLAYLDYCGAGGNAEPSRLRGLSGLAHIGLDECQDIPYEYLPIIMEVCSASIYWGFATYTGTPKTTDTTLALLWDRSSKAEWIIKCDACNYFNVPNPEQDLLKMIGKHGPICAKCGRPIRPENGGYVHSFPDRMLTFPGYHFSQITHPLHSINDTKWSRILDKVNTYQEVALYNEVLGWPYDAATSPLTLSDLINAEYDALDRNGNPVEITKPSDVAKVRHNYSYITVGCDWSGGGMLTDSYTAFAVLGLRKDGQTIDILYGERIKKGLTPTQEADIIMRWIRGTDADAFAFDNGGAGFVRTEIMKHQGLMDIPGLIVCPIQYSGPRGGDIMTLSKATREYDYTYYNLEKSRSLAMCAAAIKQQRLRFPHFKHDDPEAYARDFLALREDPRVTRSNDTVCIIIKKTGVPDDFAHAVNFGCNQIYDSHGAVLQIGKKYDTTKLANDEFVMPDDVFGPRADFQRFQDACNLNAAVIQPDIDNYF